MDSSEDIIFENKKKEFEKISDRQEEPSELESIPETDAEYEPEPEPEKPKKTKTKRKLTDEQKEVLKERLKLAREKSLETRRKNRELKNIEKDRINSENEEKILKSLESKRNKKNNEKGLMDQIATLKQKIKEQEEREIKKPVKKEIKTEPVKITGGMPKGFAGHTPVETQAQKNKRLFKQMRALGR